MNPKDQIHYDIAELLEKIAHLNIKLAGTSKIHPVEIDLLRSYLTELDKLASAMPVMPLTKPSFAIPTPTQEEANTLPSFNTHLETEPAAEAETESVEPISPTAPEHEVEETVAYVSKEPAITETETADEQVVEQTEEKETPVSAIPEELEEPTVDTEIEAFAFEDLAAPITETPEPTEPVVEEPVAEVAQTEPTTEATPEPETITEEVTTDVINTPVTPQEPIATNEPEPLPEEPIEEPQANTGPELPVVETPLSYDPPVKEPEQKRSINDMFSREGKEDLGSRFQFQNRKNLREMIDLSERYVFTKELFGGDADYYDRAIRQLNQFETLADAQAYMDNELHNKYNWTNKEQVKGQFARIVERRFA